MDSPRSDRWMALMGPLFLVLMIIALVLGGSSPAEDSSTAKILAHYDGEAGKILAGAFIVGPAIAALLVFIGWFRLSFGREVGMPRKLLQYGAVIYSAALLVTASVELAEASAADDKHGEAAQAMNYLSNAIWIPIVIGAGVLLIGAGMAVLRSGVLPSWMGWIAVVVGVLSLLGPGGFAGYFVAPIWVGAAGLMLYLRGPAGDGTAVI